MAFDHEVERAVDGQVLRWRDMSSQAMFGGVAYMIDGKMFAMLAEGIVPTKLPSELRAQALAMAGVSPFRSPSGDMFGEWIQFVMPLGEDVPVLAPWLKASCDYVNLLPAPKRRPSHPSSGRQAAW